MNSDHGLDQPSACHEITEMAGSEKKWTLSLYPDYCRLENAERETHDIERAELPLRLQTIDRGLLLRRVMIVTLGKKKTIFRLSPDVFAAVSAWIGPPTLEDLRLSLKRRFAWVMPIGILFVITALPVGDLPWEPVSFGLGLVLVLTGMLAKWWPHRTLFALDSLWFAVLAANSGWLLVQEWGWLRLVLLVVQLSLVHSGWNEFRRFAPERMAAESDEVGR